jgi:hypothetical protein
MVISPDEEVYMEGALLPYHPELALSAAEYRIDGVSAAKRNANAFGYSCTMECNFLAIQRHTATRLGDVQDTVRARSVSRITSHQRWCFRFNKSTDRWRSCRCCRSGVLPGHCCLGYCLGCYQDTAA